MNNNEIIVTINMDMINENFKSEKDFLTEWKSKGKFIYYVCKRDDKFHSINSIETEIELKE